MSTTPRETIEKMVKRLDPNLRSGARRALMASWNLGGTYTDVEVGDFHHWARWKPDGRTGFWYGSIRVTERSIRVVATASGVFDPKKKK